jgi:hypothetical protein
MRTRDPLTNAKARLALDRWRVVYAPKPEILERDVLPRFATTVHAVAVLDKPTCAADRMSKSTTCADDVWLLDIAAAGRRSEQNQWNWNVKLADGSRLTDAQHARLLDAAKKFLWSMATDPPRGRNRLSPLTLHTSRQELIVILRWMIAEG